MTASTEKKAGSLCCSIRSFGYSIKGRRNYNEDEFLCIDDLDSYTMNSPCKDLNNNSENSINSQTFTTTSSSLYGSDQRPSLTDSARRRASSTPAKPEYIPQFHAGRIPEDYGATSKRVRRSLYGVFDGHGGRNCSAFAKKYFPIFLLEDEYYGINNVKALTGALKKLEIAFLRHASSRIPIWTDGSTASVVLLEIDEVSVSATVGNIGDSRTVVSSRSSLIRTIAIPLTEDHTASNPFEQEYVYSKGGYVSRSKSTQFVPPPTKFQAYMSKYLMQAPLRVRPGGLVCTRSIGDIDCKATGLVRAEPDINHMMLTSRNRVICTASDGLWDVLSNNAAVKILVSNKHDPKLACKKLVRRAYDMRSQDNTTAVAVFLDWNYKSSKSSQVKPMTRASLDI